MGLNFASYKSLGVIHEIKDTEYTKNGYAKRFLILEIPIVANGEKTTFGKFLVLGDETGSLDFFNEGDWVEILWNLDGKYWKKPETGEQILLESKKVVDIHKRDNPFESQERVYDGADEGSSGVIAELAKNVKDYRNEGGNDLFSQKEDDDLPF